MEILNSDLPNVTFRTHAEALAVAIHCFLTQRGYQIFLPGTTPKSEMNDIGLPKNFNSQPNEWYFLYTNPSFANYFAVSCGIWGSKMLVTMEEYVKQDSEKEEYGIRSVHQFGVGQENYAHEEDLDDLEKEGEFGWEILANPERLKQLIFEMVTKFEAKLELTATPSPSERESSTSSSSSNFSASSTDINKRKSINGATQLEPQTFLVVSLVVGFIAIAIFKVVTSTSR